jgi:hypothetical protein
MIGPHGVEKEIRARHPYVDATAGPQGTTSATWLGWLIWIVSALIARTAASGHANMARPAQAGRRGQPGPRRGITGHLAAIVRNRLKRKRCRPDLLAGRVSRFDRPGPRPRATRISNMPSGPMRLTPGRSWTAAHRVGQRNGVVVLGNEQIAQAEEGAPQEAGVVSLEVGTSPAGMRGERAYG